MANVYKYFPTKAINFFVYDSLSRYVNDKIDQKKNPVDFFIGCLLSGGMAGFLSLTFVYPLDLARTRMGADIGKT